MDYIEIFKNYTLCVYLFFTICFWVYLIHFCIQKFKQQKQSIFVTIVFFVLSVITTPFIWPYISARFLIKYMTKETK